MREGLYTVSLSGGENAGIRFLAQRFRDVSAAARYFIEGYLDYAVDHGILRTLTNASFGPGNTVLRADVVDALYNIAHAGDPAALDYDKSAAPFGDMPLSTKSAAKLVWAADVGIARAEPGNIFRAEDVATREEAAVLIARYALSFGEASQVFTVLARDVLKEGDLS